VSNFVVASDSGFANVITSGTGTITGNEAAFVANQLSAGGAYYWRVHISAPDALDATSETGTIHIGSGIRPGGYRFTIHDGNACTPYDAEPQLSGDVAVSGANAWQFSGRCVGGAINGPQLFTLNLRASESNAFTGDVVARFCALERPPFLLSIGLRNDLDRSTPVPVTAVLDPTGDVAGTVTTTLDLLHQTFGIRHECPGTFRWTLAPK
jgi:hypothetical protein